MMEEKRSVGITIFGIFAFVVGVSCLISWLNIAVNYSQIINKFSRGFALWAIISAPILGILNIISGIGLLKLEPWGRMLYLYLAIYSLIAKTISLYLGITQQTAVGNPFAVIFHFSLYIFVIYYFMRPKVKEQF